MNLNFSEPKDINIENVKKIFVNDENDEPVRIVTNAVMQVATNALATIEDPLKLG